MKQKTLLWLAFILPVFQHSQLFAQSELYQIKSPDKKTEMLVSIDNQRALVYEIKFKGKKVIRKSNLGLIINGHDFEYCIIKKKYAG